MANTKWPGIILLSLLTLVICSPKICYPQLTEDFSDSDLTNQPKWFGTLNHFIINDFQQLQLNATTSGNSYLSTKVEIPDHCEWKFQIKQAFSPSSNNFSKVYLISNQKDLTLDKLEGFYLQFGEKGSNDAIELFYQKGKEIISICRGKEGEIAKSFDLYIKVIKDKNKWEVFTSKHKEGLYSELMNGNFVNPHNSGYFGFFCKYTSGNRNKFYWDNIYIGKPVIDTIPPEIISYEMIQANQLELLFSEALHPNFINKENFEINNGIGHPELVTTNSTNTKLNLYLKNNLLENTEYELTIDNVFDYSGNEISANHLALIYTVINKQDIVINEILFDPLETEEEYIEIYNRSQKVLNLKKLMFGRIRESFPNPPDTALIRISDTAIYILSQEYRILTRSSEKVQKIKEVKHPENILVLPSLPALINDAGHIFLQSDSGIMVDEVFYSKKMHHPSLNFTDGVSLEKIHYDVPGLNSDNWTSASYSSGFGTPTYQNSQFVNIESLKNKINISPQIFTPDQDGKDDAASISIQMNEPGYSGNIFIFNSNGQLIKHLVKNLLLGNKSTFFWNGKDEHGNLQPIGTYIILIEFYNPEGKTEKHKKTIAIGKVIN